jgi:hypothetical protein
MGMGVKDFVTPVHTKVYNVNARLGGEGLCVSKYILKIV